MAINDGGSAFPTLPEHHGYPSRIAPAGTGAGPGLTAREWFAGQALAGLLAADDADRWDDEPVASHAFKLADAMLAESRKEPTT